MKRTIHIKRFDVNMSHRELAIIRVSLEIFRDIMQVSDPMDRDLQIAKKMLKRIGRA